MDVGEMPPGIKPTLGIEIWHSMGFPYIAMGFLINILSVGRSNGIDDDGRISAGRLLDSRAYPVFDPGGHCGRRGTGHDGLGGVARGNIGSGAEFGAAGVGRCAIVIAVLVEARVAEAVVRGVRPGRSRG